MLPGGGAEAKVWDIARHFSHRLDTPNPPFTFSSYCRAGKVPSFEASLKKIHLMSLDSVRIMGLPFPNPQTNGSKGIELHSPMKSISSCMAGDRSCLKEEGKKTEADRWLESWVGVGGVERG